MGDSLQQNQDYYLISWVARRYRVHPQTLRLYEREGLLRPGRTRGNTRLYSALDLERLETILGLTRDMGVNLAGVEVILRLRDRVAELQRELSRLHGNPG
ncbi:MAG TPA: MerR family transcriptional regulator [Candidatus Polarisedimenticolaceae bacterium]|nr:MerR family transcriptional regulator [Candidatus Polarisedimenticolaceae bacterium]